MAAMVWYLRQRRDRLGHAFSPLDDDDSEHAHSITAVRIAGMGDKGPRILAAPRALLNLVGIGQSRHLNRSRRDILADEDRSFDWVGSRDISRGNSSFGGPSAPNSIRGWSNAVSDTLRKFARGASSSSRSRDPSTDIHWEKDLFSPEATLMAEGLPPEQIPHPYAIAGSSESYDPYADQDPSSEGPHDAAPEPVVEAEPAHTERPRFGEVRRLPTPLVTTLAPSTDFVPLSPLVEQASQNNSLASLHTHSDQQTGSGSSQGASQSPRPSSILDPNPPTASPPMRRSNSWWARFSKPSLLERRGSDLSARNSSGFIDFRDPNPPPRPLSEDFTYSRLSDIPEAATSRAPSTILSRAQSGAVTRRPTVYRDSTHGRSASSLQTANTETLERLGGTMDIIQRDATLDSHYTSPTTASHDEESGLRPSSMSPTTNGGVLRRLTVRSEPSQWSAESSAESPMVLSPLASRAATPPPEPIDPISEEEHQATAAPSSSSSSSTPAPPTVPSSGSEDVAPRLSPAAGDTSPLSPGVADRVWNFERRMSREREPPPSPTNTRHREERSSPRTVVRYGLVPRASLFVANPDGAAARGSDG
jgi:hypothetical protein